MWINPLQGWNQMQRAVDRSANPAVQHQVYAMHLLCDYWHASPHQLMEPSHARIESALAPAGNFLHIFIHFRRVFLGFLLYL
jgi:hypothetical protein